MNEETKFVMAFMPAFAYVVVGEKVVSIKKKLSPHKDKLIIGTMLTACAGVVYVSMKSLHDKVHAIPGK